MTWQLDSVDYLIESESFTRPIPRQADLAGSLGVSDVRFGDSHGERERKLLAIQTELDKRIERLESRIAEMERAGC